MDNEPRLTIEPRPQIAVMKINISEICISVASIDSDYRSVKNEDVTIPIECAKQIAQALIDIANEAGA